MDVNQIYKKLGHLVHEQGELVDSIEANVELASVRVNEANKEITRASELKVFSLSFHFFVDSIDYISFHQKICLFQGKIRRKKMCLLLTVIVILVIIVLIIATQIN